MYSIPNKCTFKICEKTGMLSLVVLREWRNIKEISIGDRNRKSGFPFFTNMK